ncbi:MAG: hypothetical protein HUU55_13990 [Myxococcales bacterium]|nr:hypothetical protein [Myxococcales bacterium]
MLSATQAMYAAMDVATALFYAWSDNCRRLVAASVMFLAGIGVLCAPDIANCQIDLPDVSASRGLRVGEFRFSPRAEILGGYDNNLFYDAFNDAREPARVALLDLSAGIQIENPDYQDFHVNLDASGTYHRVFSPSASLNDAQSSFGGDLLFLAEFFPKSILSFGVFDVFKHTIDAPNYSSERTFNRLFNKVGATVAFHPGNSSGRGALDVELGYAYEINRFVDFERLDHDAHDFDLLLTWKFFPKTALVVDGNLRLENWSVQDEQRGRTDSMPFRILGGVNGFVTKQIALQARVGFGQGFYSSGTDIQTVLGKVVLTWTPANTSIFSVGYDRDFVQSYYANFYSFDRFSASIKQRFWNRLEIRADAAFSWLDYAKFDPSGISVLYDVAQPYVVVNEANRGESAVDAGISVEVVVINYLSVYLSYNFRQLFSDFEMYTSTDNVLGAGDQLVDRGGYARHVAKGGIIVRY